MCLAIRILGCLLLCFTALVPSAPGEELEDRVFSPPPGWFWMGQGPPDETADHSADPFDHGEPEKPAWLTEAERLASFPRYPHLIPALGAEPPYDMRGLLEQMGITFGAKSLALSCDVESRTRRILFVRNTREQLNNIETILLLAFRYEPMPHARLTFRWAEKFPTGRGRLLLERTLLCRHGQRTKFQRHRGNELIEEIEFEADLLDDGATVDMNSACDLSSGRLRLKTQIQTRLTSGTPEFQRLATGRGTRPGSVTELSARSEQCADIPVAPEEVLAPPYTELTRLIGEQVAAAEQQPAVGLPEKEADLFWLKDLYPIEQDDAHHRAPSLAHLHSTELRDARGALKAKGISLDADDLAWYAPQSGLLYLHAGRQARILTAGFVREMLAPELGCAEGIFEATERRRRKILPLTHRNLIVRSGQKASIKSPIQGAPDEQLEAEVSLTEDRERAYFNVALNHYPVGRETWSYWGQTNIGIDGKSTVPLVSGRSVDSGGALRTISLRARLSLNSWLTLVQDPVRKAEAIRQFEAAGLPAAPKAR